MLDAARCVFGRWLVGGGSAGSTGMKLLCRRRGLVYGRFDLAMSRMGSYHAKKMNVFVRGYGSAVASSFNNGKLNVLRALYQSWDSRASYSPMDSHVCRIPSGLVASVLSDFMKEALPVRYATMSRPFSKEDMQRYSEFLFKELRVRVAYQIFMLKQVVDKLSEGASISMEDNGADVRFSNYLTSAFAKLMAVFKKLEHVTKDDSSNFLVSGNNNLCEFISQVEEMQITYSHLIPLLVCGIRESVRSVPGRESNDTTHELKKATFDDGNTTIENIVENFLLSSVGCNALMKQYTHMCRFLLPEVFSNGKILLPSSSRNKLRNIQDQKVTPTSRRNRFDVGGTHRYFANDSTSNKQTKSAECLPSTAHFSFHGFGFAPACLMQCKINESVQACIHETRLQCIHKFGWAPSVKFVEIPDGNTTSDQNNEFYFFPFILKYVVSEILKNALAASTRFDGHRQEHSKLDIQCAVKYHTPNSAWILVSDAAGGIEDDVLRNISNCIRHDSAENVLLRVVADNAVSGLVKLNADPQKEMEGYGLGMAMTKAFLTYVGGQLHVISSPSAGSTDVFILIPSLEGSRVEVLPSEALKWAHIKSSSMLKAAEIDEDERLIGKLPQNPINAWKFHRQSIDMAGMDALLEFKADVDRNCGAVVFAS